MNENFKLFYNYLIKNTPLDIHEVHGSILFEVKKDAENWLINRFWDEDFKQLWHAGIVPRHYWVKDFELNIIPSVDWPALDLPPIANLSNAYPTLMFHGINDNCEAL